jgi:hypothetical protein
LAIVGACVDVSTAQRTQTRAGVIQIVIPFGKAEAQQILTMSSAEEG